MLIFLDARLAYLATPKTGTTAVETTLSARADIVFAGQGKHMIARRFRRRVIPFVEKTFEVRLESVAVMREPLDQLRSWYRYRSGERQKGGDRSTAALKFEKFVLDVLEDNPPPHADVGSQFRFLTSAQGEVLVDHLFSYENTRGLADFFTERLRAPVKFPRQNVSPATDAPLSLIMEAQLRKERARDFALYDRLTGSGGYLRRST